MPVLSQLWSLIRGNDQSQSSEDTDSDAGTLLNLNQGLSISSTVVRKPKTLTAQQKKGLFWFSLLFYLGAEVMTAIFLRAIYNARAFSGFNTGADELRAGLPWGNDTAVITEMNALCTAHSTSTWQGGTNNPSAADAYFDSGKFPLLSGVVHHSVYLASVEAYFWAAAILTEVPAMLAVLFFAFKTYKNNIQNSSQSNAENTRSKRINAAKYLVEFIAFAIIAIPYFFVSITDSNDDRSPNAAGAAWMLDGVCGGENYYDGSVPVIPGVEDNPYHYALGSAEWFRNHLPTATAMAFITHFVASAQEFLAMRAIEKGSITEEATPLLDHTGAHRSLIAQSSM